MEIMQRAVMIDLVRQCLADVLAMQGRSDEIFEASALLGPGALLDSLGLVTLIVDVEQRISDDLRLRVTLADERAMSAASSPFRTVSSLADHALARVAERSGGTA
jgi:acyl carrier protein